MNTEFEQGKIRGEELLGTCESLNDDDDEHSIEYFNGIDEITLCCETCSWWCEPCEIDDDGNCEDCQ